MFNNKNSDKISNGVNNCDKIKELLSAYIDDELSEKEATAVRRHLEECLDCEEEAVELNKVRRMMKELPVMKAPAELADRINSELGAIPQPKPINIFVRYHWVIPGLATAAAALLVVYVGLILLPAKTTDVTNNTAVIHEYMPAPKSDSFAELEKAKPELFTLDIKGKSQEPVVFSQKVNIACRNNDKALQDIKSLATQYSGEISGDKLIVATVTKKESLSKEKTDTEKERKPGKIYLVKVTLPLNRKEAFIEQLKIQKVGNVKVAELEKAPTGSLTVNDILADKVVNYIEEKLNGEMQATKPDEDKKNNDDSYGYSAGGGSKQAETNRGRGTGAPMPNKAMAAPPAPPSSAPQEKSSVNKEAGKPSREPTDNADDNTPTAAKKRKSGESNESPKETDSAEQLKKIDQSLIILHDLELQEKAKEQQKNETTQGDSKEDGEFKKDGKEEPELGLIELVIILNEE